MIRQRCLDAILKERARQERLKADGKFTFTCADTHSGARAILPQEKLTILVEEVGEVARAIQDGNVENLREELTQCAAVCLAWCESL